MKNSILALFLLTLAYNNPISAQENGATFELKNNPEDTFAFVKLKLRQPDDRPYKGQVTLIGSRNTVKTQTNDEGFVKVKLPYNDKYTIKTGDKTSLSLLELNQVPYVTYEYSAYTEPHWLFKLNYTNPKGQPLEGEEVTLQNIKDSSKVYKQMTDKKGVASFVVPAADYKVSLKYWENYKTIYAKPKEARNQLITSFSWMGSKEVDRRAAVADSIARAYAANLAARWQADSLRLLDEVPMSLDSGAVTRNVQRVAEKYKKELAKNPQLFEQGEKASEVLAPLVRISKKVPKQIVITDVTWSMTPYLCDVAIWHALNLAPKNTTQYTFFNDGDGKSYRPMGKTGGFYHCFGNVKDLKVIVGLMQRSHLACGANDDPENDMEALLAAAAKKSKGEELVLIADNNSPVRDMVLLDKLVALQIPVRVVLCGLSGEYTWGGEVNPQYLAIAYATGGSVHTIKEDIWDLAKTAEGKTITINGKEFKLEEGRFIPLNKN